MKNDKFISCRRIGTMKAAAPVAPLAEARS
jgi:hypothetical protein